MNNNRPFKFVLTYFQNGCVQGAHYINGCAMPDLKQMIQKKSCLLLDLEAAKQQKRNREVLRVASEDEQDPKSGQARFLAENWDAPIVVTSTVRAVLHQLFSTGGDAF